MHPIGSTCLRKKATLAYKHSQFVANQPKGLTILWTFIQFKKKSGYDYYKPPQ
jgi:hypothetical protein